MGIGCCQKSRCKIFYQELPRFLFLSLSSNHSGSASTEYNTTSKQRSKKLIGKDLPAEMMCSDFVCTAYQCRPDEPKIKLDAQRVIPMKLEDYLNKHPEDFIFLGKIARKDAISFNVEYAFFQLLTYS